MQEQLVILGASSRAAAFSALRAELRSWCADLFGDADLQARCPSITLPRKEYPHGFARLLENAPPGPWIYTGALENCSRVVGQLSRKRRLWGNDASVIAKARAPVVVEELLRVNGIPCPQVCLSPPDLNLGKQWLVKPVHSAGGTGIRVWRGVQNAARSNKQVYFQEYVEGQSCAAVYLGDGQSARLLGVTRQLVGEHWSHAGPFQYCGSIGPLALGNLTHQKFERMGTVLARGCGLRGLFGVDCILCEDVPWLMEINPRYTASVEVLEYATGLPALGLHRQIFDSGAPTPSFPARILPRKIIGKAILFAKAPLVFPLQGPWSRALSSPVPISEMPSYADIPQAGQPIETGRPILTFFSRADSPAAVLDVLQQMAADLDQWLFGR